MKTRYICYSVETLIWLKVDTKDCYKVIKNYSLYLWKDHSFENEGRQDEVCKAVSNRFCISQSKSSCKITNLMFVLSRIFWRKITWEVRLYFVCFKRTHIAKNFPSKIHCSKFNKRHHVAPCESDNGNNDTKLTKCCGEVGSIIFVLQTVKPSWCNGLHYFTTSFKRVWTQVLRRFKSCSWHGGGLQWWELSANVPDVRDTAYICTTLARMLFDNCSQLYISQPKFYFKHL